MPILPFAGITILPSLKQVAYRYKKYKSLKETPDTRTCEVRKFAKRLNDLGDFMGNLQSDSQSGIINNLRSVEEASYSIIVTRLFSLKIPLPYCVACNTSNLILYELKCLRTQLIMSSVLGVIFAVRLSARKV